MVQWRWKFPIKFEAATAAVKLIGRRPLFQGAFNWVLHSGICLKVDVIFERLHFDSTDESKLLAINTVAKWRRFKECSCDKLKLGTLKEVWVTTKSVWWTHIQYPNVSKISVQCKLNSVRETINSAYGSLNSVSVQLFPDYLLTWLCWSFVLWWTESCRM